MDEAVAITGMGMVTGVGVGVEAAWRGVVEGREGLKSWEGDGHGLAGMMVAGCGELGRPLDLPVRLWRGLSRTQQLACVASDEALLQAGFGVKVEKQFGERSGLFLATTVCGMDVSERFYAQWRVDRVGADVALMRRIGPGEVANLLSRRHGIGRKGLRSVCLSTCVGSAMAMGTGMDAINLGECDWALVGGTEALCRVVLSGFASLKVAAKAGCRPFDRDRPGITVGEGAGMLVLERVSHAEARGAKILGYLRGYGVSCDARHLTAPDADAVQGKRAMREALTRAGMTAAEIGYINAHGTGTRDNDAMEARAIEGIFRENLPAVSSTKRATGHTFGAAGVIEAIFCVQAVREGVVPVNGGSMEGDAGLWKGADPVVRAGSLVKGIEAAMSTNFAFGGNNTAVVVSGEGGNSEFRIQNSEWRRGKVLGVLGAASVGEFAGEEEVAGMERLPGLGIRALDQAGAMMGGTVAGEGCGLVFVSAWGMIDSTVGYLESMLEAEGRYASPRHFSRSVYSAATSLVAIHFGILGPCLTLAFDEREDAVKGALLQAWRMLAAGRCAKVAVVWAEQGGAVAEDLVKRAAEGLRRREYERYVRGLGEGAAAVVVALPEAGGLWEVDLERELPAEAVLGKPYPMDGAARFLAGLLMSRGSGGGG